MKTLTKISALATTILLSGAVMAPANAAPPEKNPTAVDIPTVTASISVPTTAALSFEAPKITSVAAPVPVQELPTPTQTVQPAQTTRTTATAPVAAQSATQAPVKAAAPAVPTSGIGAALLASAYGQVGTIQDCTAMVEKALRSVGKSVGDLAPAQFFQFGTVVGTPQPGDILISAGHVGIYAGNGQMVSGGFNGNQTRVHPVSYVGAFTAVRVA